MCLAGEEVSLLDSSTSTPLMHSWSTRAFVWEWDPISRLIHEDLGLRFPVAIKGVFPFLGLMSSLLTLSGLDQGWWIGVKVITEVNRVSVSCVLCFFLKGFESIL